MTTKYEQFDTSDFALGMAYLRPQVASMGGVTVPDEIFTSNWSQGIVEFANAVLLFVTLEKTHYDYEDMFDGASFWWQSQNRQTQRTPVIQRVGAGDIPVYLFARLRSKDRGVTQPFVYCGGLSAPAMEDEKPVRCLFGLLDYVEDAGGALGELYQWRPDAKLPEGAGIRRQLALKVRSALGQGRQSDAELRLALEAHSMALASAYYTHQGFSVEDTSKNHPYDLVCRKDQNEVRVEVKGTVTQGMSVILTAGEVRSARTAGVVSHLFVVHSIKVTRQKGRRVLSGGAVRLIAPWVPGDADLRPREFAYTLPAE